MPIPKHSEDEAPQNARVLQEKPLDFSDGIGG
jgi:hypothetical protein